MAYDIYGGRLERGHCEVHPYVHEEYPCSLCMAASNNRRREQEDYERYGREQEAAYYSAMMGDIEYESWLPASQALAEGK